MVDEIFKTVSIAAGATVEVLAAATWSDAFATPAILEEFGVFGDLTAGNKWELYLGGDKMGEGDLHHTVYHRDYLLRPNVMFTGSVRCKIFNNTAGALTFQVKVKITKI